MLILAGVRIFCYNVNILVKQKQKNEFGAKRFAVNMALISFVFSAFLFFASSAQAAEASPVYRFYSAKNKAYFYTISKAEKDKIIKKYSTKTWKYEGVKFYAFGQREEDLKPVYRFRSTKYNVHFFTISESEKNELVSGYPANKWVYEGIAFYAYASEQTETTPVYRLKRESNKATFYTTSSGEKNCLTSNFSNEWQFESVAWWIPQEGADLSDDDSACTALGPEISVGLWSYSRSELEDESFKIHANKNYNIKDRDGQILGTVAAGEETRVKYAGDKKLKIYKSLSETEADKEIIFNSADGKNTDLIFDVHQPDSSYDEYRGKIKLRYSDETKKIWVINILPLEQYTWGDGELAGTGDADHNRVMTTIFRTYGQWKKENSTQWATEGFKVISTSANQIYRGYNWEADHPRIKQAAQETRGKIIKYKDKIALSPYSSWSDGRTRSFKERWGSDNFPWCQSKKDSYGKHPSMSTGELEDAGNHMVGVIAQGSLKLADSKNWKWDKIIKYYLSGIKFESAY